jgi:hypothetical protein
MAINVECFCRAQRVGPFGLAGGSARKVHSPKKRPALPRSRAFDAYAGIQASFLVFNTLRPR